MADDNPSTNGNGEYRRGEAGRFVPGTAGGPGRPKAMSGIARLRERLAEEITEKDVADCIAALRSIVNDPAARAGDRLAAIAQLLDRGVGKPQPGDLGDVLAGNVTLMPIRFDGDDDVMESVLTNPAAYEAATALAAALTSNDRADPTKPDGLPTPPAEPGRNADAEIRDFD
jgi:hypothetical protein